MPRPRFTANRQSANTLIWRRFDLFRRWRLLAWLIAAPLGYSYSVALLQPLFRDSAWFAWYPLMYTLALALIFHKSLIRLLWNPPILVCDEHGLTAYNEYGRWLGQLVLTDYHDRHYRTLRAAVSLEADCHNLPTGSRPYYRSGFSRLFS